MSLGEKIREARLASNLSQRELCGERITRNMLSQIEHGTAKPSMQTLCYLAERLGRPLSYFLEEAGSGSGELARLTRARKAYDAHDPQGVLDALDDPQAGSALVEREEALLRALSLLALAEKATHEGKNRYALELCARAREVGSPYFAPEIARASALLEGMIAPERAVALTQMLPSIDAELMLRARASLESGDAVHACALLDSCEEKTDAWHLLRARADMATGAYALARDRLHGIEASFPKETAPLLELCARELGDYETAYFYACKQRE